MMAVVDALAAGVVVLLCCLAAWQDVRSREIPDHFAATILVLFVATAVPGLVAGTLPLLTFVWAVLAMVVTFLVGLGLFSIGWLGGGDVKLLTAVVLWILPSDMAGFLTLVVMAGGVVAMVLVAALSLLRFRTWNQGIMNEYFTSLGEDRAAVPYGLAIAVGVVGTWLCGGVGLALTPI